MGIITPKIVQCCPTAEGTLTGGWVGGEVLNHASLHDRDPPAAEDNGIYRNNTWKIRSKISESEPMLCLFLFRRQSPVTVLCPSVRLLQKSSTMDINSMSCRWKPDSLFHQSCQCAMSWEPFKQVICHYLLLLLRTLLWFLEPHLCDFLSLFFISGWLNSQFQSLIL